MAARAKESSSPQEPRELMLRRLLRFAVGSSLVRGWLKKSPSWFSIAVALWLFRVVDKRLAKSGRTKRSNA
jgi:hypothetical protein